MGLKEALRRRLMDSPDSWRAGWREQRARWLADTFPDLAQMSLIDLGGRIRTWERMPVRPKRVHVVNLESSPPEVPHWAEFDHGDACALPAHVVGRRYDLVFSNSVIEHVGGHERRLRFAEAVHQLADAYWIQTPYRYFPVEPHYFAPGMQFLPVVARAEVAWRWPLARSAGGSREETVKRVLQVELLDRTQMRHYFPDSALLTEKIFGFPKSLIAFKTGSGDVVPPHGRH
jgi:hypothetical protein